MNTEGMFCEDEGTCVCGWDCLNPADPWQARNPAAWVARPALYVPMTEAEKKEVQDRAKAKFVYLGEPWTVSWCDSEKGWSECACGAIWHYKTACSMPRELWQDDCSGDTHAICYGEVLDDCHCGGLDPYIQHPCIGHDRATGEPLLGPSKFIDYADRRY